MNRKRIVLILALLLLLSGCGRDTPHTDGTGPGRMVRRIEVAIHPENMNELLTLLRSMENDERPETEPDIDGGQSLYTATVTFSNGQQNIYYLLGHTYLRLGDNDWCVIDTDLSRKFTDFIGTHPSDDTPSPTETTAPTE